MKRILPMMAEPLEMSWKQEKANLDKKIGIEKR
jgi:hypothetical protein